MKKNVFNTIPVQAGAQVLVNCKDQQIAFPLSIAAHPGGGGTMLVECSLHPDADVVGRSGVTWFPWADGTVSTDKFGTLVSPVSALRLTATTAAGVVELAC